MTIMQHQWEHILTEGNSHSHLRASNRDARAWVNDWLVIATLEQLKNSQVNVWTKVSSSFSQPGFPKKRYQFIRTLKEEPYDELRKKIAQVFIQTDAQENLLGACPIEILLHMIRKSRAGFWLPVNLEKIKTKGIDVSMWTDEFPLWMINSNITAKYPPYVLALTLAEAQHFSRIRDMLLTEVEEKRFELHQLFKAQHNIQRLATRHPCFYS